MGFTPVDMGCMSSAREIENIPLRLLPAWKIPTFLALGLFICFFTYNLIRQVIHPYIREQKNKLYKIPIEVVNTTLPCVSYVMLSLVYLPGVLAACSQLYYGTKYRRFPDWLDQWLQHRKQIGLLSFFCAALHAVYSLCLPMRRSHRYLLIETAVKQVTGCSSGQHLQDSSKLAQILGGGLNSLAFSKAGLGQWEKAITSRSNSPTAARHGQSTHSVFVSIESLKFSVTRVSTSVLRICHLPGYTAPCAFTARARINPLCHRSQKY